MKLDLGGQAVGQAERRGGRRYLLSIDLARAVGIVLIVATHCWPDIPWTAAEAEMMPLYFRSSTVLLVFISGFMFNYITQRSDQPIRRYATQRLVHIWSAYLVISAPILFVIFFVHKRADVWPWVYEMPLIGQAVIFLITGKHIAYLWYIPAISLFILLSWCFRFVDRKKLYGWIIPLAAVAATVLGRDSIYGAFSAVGKAIFILPSYLIGMYFCNYYVANGYRVGRVPTLISLFLVTAISAAYFVWNRFDIHVLWIQKVALVILLIRIFDDYGSGTLLGNILKRIATLAFPIYFLHGYAINLLRLAYSDAALLELVGNPLLARIIYLLVKVAVVTALSMALCFMVQALVGRRRSRYLIGA
nr:acyltransferase [Sphingomonas sp. Y57]